MIRSPVINRRSSDSVRRSFGISAQRCQVAFRCSIRLLLVHAAMATKICEPLWHNRNMAGHKKRQPLIAFVLLSLVLCTHSQAQPKFVTTRGSEFIAPEGRRVLLRGISLGNWLVPEGYMFKFKTANSPRLIQSVVNELIGEDEARRFWKAFRENYITREDIRFIKQSGFNSVRVPFSY